MSYDTRMRALRHLASGCVLLMLVVTTASAWLRLSQPRPACADWPGCRSASVSPGPLRAAASRAPPALETVARGAHRAAASLVLLASLALVVLALARRPRDAQAGAQALALLAFALGLAALGIVTPGSRAPAVLLGNLLGGLLLLAWAWRLLRGLQGARPTSAAAWAWIAALAWLLQAALGALSGTRFGEVPAYAHLALASALLPLTAWIGWRTRREGRTTEGLALMALAAMHAALGTIAATGAAAAPAVLAHNLAAALGLALLLGLTSPRPMRAHAEA